MAYENLKNAIKQVIKQNGNQEITGPILQSTLLSMVDNIPEVVQELGEAEDKVMSQKAVSDKLSHLSNKTQFYDCSNDNATFESLEEAIKYKGNAISIGEKEDSKADKIYIANDGKDNLARKIYPVSTKFSEHSVITEFQENIYCHQRSSLFGKACPCH